MKRIIIGAILASFALTLTTTDADARRRKRHNPKPKPIVRVVPAPVSVFDTLDWQPAVTLPGFMSVSQAIKASTYIWEAEDIFPPVKVEWTHASEYNTMDQELISGQKPVISRAVGVIWGMLGAVCAACLALGGMAWRQNKEWTHLT